MLSKILLLPFILAEDAPEAPPSDAPLFGAYTEDTAESYDHDKMSMVWISFKTADYQGWYYDNDSKKDMQETSADSVTSTFGPRMTKLAGEIEGAVNKKYHIVFFDSKEYRDHAVEGLNCKVDEQACVSVLLPMAGDKEDDEEVVYTKPFPGEFKSVEESSMNFILDFVKLVESESTDKDEWKFTPSFDEDDEAGEDDPPEDDGFGSDDDKEV